jgi:hypothetical protein
LKRRVLRFAAILGAVTVTTLAVAPAFAAAPISQSSAQSLQLSISGNSAVSQKVTATNDGTTETKNDASTVPTIASILPGNNLLGAGVAPQQAGANKDGTSYACAGIAGTGGGIVKVGNSSCDLNGKPLTLDLGHLDLGDVILGSDSALGSALNGPLSPILQPLGVTVNQVVTSLSSNLAGTPLGQIKLGGSLSAIEGSCIADPDKATGDARLVDSSGGSNATPIGVTIPDGKGGTQTLTLLNLPANPPPNTHVLVDLDKVTQTLVTALNTELDTAVAGALKGLGLGGALQQVQDQVVAQLVANLQPLLKALQDNILDITLNKQSTGDNGRSVDVTALDLQVLPAAKQFAGSSLISGVIGHVNCGPNTRPAAVSPPSQPSQPTVKGPKTPDVPTVVDSGLAGHQDHTARNVLGATGALLLIAGTAGLVGYRRMLTK